MSGYTAILSADQETVEIPVSLFLDKDRLASALIYILAGASPSAPAEQEVVTWLATVDQAGALEAIADNVITYGQSNIFEHGDNPAIRRASYEAVKRLWPDLR